MDYTTRYDRGIAAVNNPQFIADPTETYGGQTLFFRASDSDVEQHRPFLFIVPNSVTNQTTYTLPPASEITIVASVGSSNASGFDGGFEIALVSFRNITQPLETNVVSVAWLPDRGSGKIYKDWVMSVTGMRGPCSVMVKSGINSASAPDASSNITITAYLSDSGGGVRDRINPIFTVPQFDLDGNYLFSTNASGNNRPLKQRAQNQREFHSDLLSFSFGTPDVKRLNIFGGPWVGQMTHTVNTGTVSTEVKGMDAEALGSVTGYSIDTDVSQRGIVQIVDPLRYDWTQFSVGAGAVAQNAAIRLGLTSPTR